MDWRELSEEVLSYFEGAGDNLLALIQMTDSVTDYLPYFADDMSEVYLELDFDDDSEYIEDGEVTDTDSIEGMGYDEDGGAFDIDKCYFYHDDEYRLVSTDNPYAFSVRGLLNIDIVRDIYETWEQIEDENAAEHYDFLDALPKFVQDLFVEYTYFNGDND